MAGQTAVGPPQEKRVYMKGEGRTKGMAES